MTDELPLKLSDLNFSFDLSKAVYELDALQNEMLNLYLRTDDRFKRAFHTNWTNQFIQFMKDSAKLKEPIHLSCMGKTRSGKSYGMMSVCIIHSLLNNKMFSEKYICANSFEFIERLKLLIVNELLNSIFLIDEEKKSVYGAGAVAKKMKITDVANIIAINNISSISLTPDTWANEQANYGLRAFGRCRITKTVRFMLYNLQEGGRGGSLPLGMVYLPIFTSLLPEPYATDLETKYLERKHQWVTAEMRGEGDVLMTIKLNQAKAFMRDEQFQGIKKKNERQVYIQMKLGSEWTHSECSEILEMTSMLKGGVKLDN